MPTQHDECPETASLIRASAGGAPKTTASFLLRVDGGPDAGTSFPVDGSVPCRVLVGTSSACEVRLSDPSVSRRHAAVDVTGESMRLTDLGSKNGTFVNGLRVLDVYLGGSERVRLGNTTMSVERMEGDTRVTMSTEHAFGRMVGASEAMRRLYPLCARLAKTDISVIIEGETGTGKEVLAESLHEMGPRAAKPFIVFDCTSVPPNLMEAALFGHEKGAFTGAVSQNAGVFEQSDGGSLLLDEIGDLDISLQPKLLRAIQRKEVRRVGGTQWISVDVRFMAATRRNLDTEVQGGRFRDDLFYRLNIGRIELPPLRERQGDLELLVAHFWTALGGGSTPIPDTLLQRFRDYTWPGNVRELQNAVARHLALGDLVDFEQDRCRSAERYAVDAPAPEEGHPEPDFIDEVIRSGELLTTARQRVIDEFQSRYVRHVLRKHGGNVAKAAAASGIARRYLYVLRAREKDANR